MEIAFSEKISPQLSAALLSTPYELGKEGGLSSGYLPESDSWEVVVKYVGDIEKIKEKYDQLIWAIEHQGMLKANAHPPKGCA